jgi:hypothetical protein
MRLKTGSNKKTYVSIVVLKLVITLCVAWGVIIVRNPPWPWMEKFKPLGINPDPNCLHDVWHYNTQEENFAIRHYEYVAKPMLFLSSLMIDYTFINAISVWILECKTARLLYAVLIFYLVRAANQVNLNYQVNLSFQVSNRINMGDTLDTFTDGTIRYDVRLLF